MNYELLKEMVDAGYETDYNLDGISDFDKRTFNGDIPLEELIEACGCSIKLEINREGLSVATALRKEFDIYKPGQTPTEAVAKLWLALNKK